MYLCIGVGNFENGFTYPVCFRIWLNFFPTMAAQTVLQYSSWSVKALEQRYRNNEVIMLVLYACISLNMAHKLSIQTHRRYVCWP